MTRGDFDYLYQEGVEGSPKMVTIALHSRLIGRPGRLAGLRQFIEYIASKPDVWVTTRADIAKHWREKYPYKGPQRVTKY
jgi:peptidoglycan/xylan/chitin deacetylase (PgdA/CDA1 family)